MACDHYAARLRRMLVDVVVAAVPRYPTLSFQPRDHLVSVNEGVPVPQPVSVGSAPVTV